MSEQNKQMVRRSIEEIWNQENYDVVHEVAARDLVVHASLPANDIHGADNAVQFYAMLHKAFPDIHFTVEDQVAEGDRVVTRWTARGTHTGEFQDFAPTGKQATVMGIDIDRIAGGKIIECWTTFDELGMLQQLGLLAVPS